MNLPLAHEHLARARVEQHGLVRRRRGALNVAAARQDQAEAAGPRALALPERDLPALEERAGQAELGRDADSDVVLVPRRDHLVHPRRERLAIGGVDAVEAHPGALLDLPFELVGLADHRGGGYAEAGFALGAGEARARRQGDLVASAPVGRADADHRGECIGHVVRQLAAPARADEAGQERPGNGAGVEPARLRVAERVLGEGRRGGRAQQGVGVREGGVEAEQGGERLAPSLRHHHRLPLERRLLDPAAASATSASPIQPTPSAWNS